MFWSARRKVAETIFRDSVLYGHVARLYEARNDREGPMNQRMKRQAVKGKRIAKAVVAGFGSLLSISTAQASHYHPAPSAQAALRADFARVGRDMSVVVERERRHEKASS
jgi:hypothetical protein